MDDDGNGGKDVWRFSERPVKEWRNVGRSVSGSRLLGQRIWKEISV